MSIRKKNYGARVGANISIIRLPPLLFDSILKEDTKNIAVLSVCPRGVPKDDFKGSETFTKRSPLFANVNISFYAKRNDVCRPKLMTVRCFLRFNRH